MSWFNRTVLLLVLILGLYAVFSHGGLYDLWLLKKNIARTETKNSQLLQQKTDLAGQIGLLQSSNFYAEKIAREELGMARKDEIIIYFKEDKGQATATPATDKDIK